MSKSRIYHRSTVIEKHPVFVRNLQQNLIDSSAEQGLESGGIYIDTYTSAYSARPKLIELLHESKEGDFLVIATMNIFSKMSAVDIYRLQENLDKLSIFIPNVINLSETTEKEQVLLRSLLLSMAKFSQHERQIRILEGMRLKSSSNIGRPERKDRNSKFLELYIEASKSEGTPNISALSKIAKISKTHAHSLVKKFKGTQNSDNTATR